METKHNDWFTMSEAALYLGVHTTTLKGWFQGRDKSGFKEFTTKVGGKRVISKVNMSRFINGQRPWAAESPQWRAGVTGKAYGTRLNISYQLKTINTNGV